MQIPTVLREYSMTSVTEGIDAIATTRVVIAGDVSADKPALTSNSNRSFRYSLTPPPRPPFLSLGVCS